MGTKVCLLIRVSSEKQETRKQLIEPTDFCKKHKYKIVRTISSKISGSKTNTDRLDLIELPYAAKRKKFTKAPLTEICRLGRKAKDIRNTIDILHQQKISIAFKNFAGLESLEEKNNEIFVTNIIISIYAGLAQEQCKLLSERTKSGPTAGRKEEKYLDDQKGKKNEMCF